MGPEILSYNALTDRIESGEILSAIDIQRATMATARTQRALHREKQVTQSIYSHQKLVAILPPGTLMKIFK